MSECFKCKGYCCRYVTVDIPRPKKWEDYDEIRWFILHKEVIVYKVEHEKNWRIEFRTPCDYLDEASFMCRKYEKRPEVCAEYITDECGKDKELSSDGCQIYLESEDDLRRYMEANIPDMASAVFK